MTGTPEKGATDILSTGFRTAALSARVMLGRRAGSRSGRRRRTPFHLSRQGAEHVGARGNVCPLEAVLAADEEQEQGDVTLREVLNYVRAAEYAFSWTAEGRPLTVGLLTDLQQRLVRGTAADDQHSGRLRDIQVLIGAHPGARVQDARFVPRPPGLDLEHQMRDLVDWMARDHVSTAAES